MSRIDRVRCAITTMILGACLAPACGGSSGASFSPTSASGSAGTLGSGASGGLSTGSGGSLHAGGSSAMAGNAGSGMGLSGNAGSGASGGVSGGGTAGSGASGMSAGGAGAGAAGSSGSSGLCTADNTPCVGVSGNGICQSQSCTDCADDPSCVTAYGVGNLCISGSCQPGDCRVSPDCANNPNGAICGASQPNTCGKCSADSQCSTGNMCDTTSGKCVTNTCTGTGTACTQNSADLCCAGACFTGTCCDSAQCGPSAVCTNHTCTTCDTVTGLNPVYLVDPAAGNDGSATGAGTSGGGTPDATCRFATITRALQAIGASPAVGTVIQVMGPATVPDATNKKAIPEAFPIAVPHNVTITAANGAVVVNPPAGSVAFSLNAAASGIDGALGGGGSLTIEGATHGALTGITDGSGSTDGTFLRNVVIQNFTAEGVVASGNGVLGIQAGVSVLNNGFGTGKHSGLLIAGTAHVNLNVASGAATTSFNKNAQHGILVSGGGWIVLKGTVSGSSGTVECRQNATSGLAIAQTPGNVTPPMNTINGLFVAGTTGGNGIRIEGGSTVTVQNSTSLGNAGSGVLVTTSLTGLIRNNDLSKISLGNGGTPGLNKLQADAGNAPNQGAGVCLQMDANAGTLLAQGNMFSAGTNCSQTAAVLTFSDTACDAGRDLGIMPAVALASVTGNDIKVDKCSHP